MPTFLFPSPTAYLAGVNMSPYTVSVELTSEDEEVDVSTFAAPTATDSGKITQSIAMNLRFTKDWYTALSPYVGQDVSFSMTPVAGTLFSALVKFGTLPLGSFEAGQPVESTLNLRVRDSISVS